METWFEIVEPTKELCQGDIIYDFPVPVIGIPPKKAHGDPQIELHTYDVIILSQTCDLKNRKISMVLLAAVLPSEEFEQYKSGLKENITKETIRRGYHHHLFLLGHVDFGETLRRGFQLVNFRKTYSVPREYVENYAELQVRPRLLPPYRENFAQAFGRFISRIALKIEIPKFVEESSLGVNDEPNRVTS